MVASNESTTATPMKSNSDDNRSDSNNNSSRDGPVQAAATTSKKKAKPRETVVPTNQDTISKKIGYIVEEFKCSHNNFQGILYAGPLGLIFLGRFLLFEWTVVLKWDDVVKVCKKHPPNWNNNSATNKQQTAGPPPTTNSGITIETRGKNAQRYDFERFFDESKALNILVSLHNDSILDLTPRAVPTPRVVSRGLRRMNSDPLRISNLFNFDDIPTALEDGGGVLRTQIMRHGEGLGGSKDDARKLSTVDYHPPVVFGRATTFDVSRPNRFDGDTVSLTNDQTTTSSTNIQLARRRSDIQKVNGVDVATEWMQITNNMTDYKEHVIKDRELLCSLCQFVEEFVQNNARHSIGEFMTQIGEMDVNVSQWEDDTEGSAQKRSIEYTHPVDVPMAPPTARARKEQTYRRYGDRGLILETKTFVSDVPMTDCFYVVDVMRVEARDDGKKVSMDIHFDIHFVKSTIFRSIIERTTKSEFEKFFHTMANFVDVNLGDGTEGPTAPTTKVAAPTRTKPISVAVDVPSRLPTILSILVLLMQIWILVDMRLVKLELRHLAAEIAVDRVQVCEAASMQSYAVDGDA